MSVSRLAMIGSRGHYNYALRALPELPDVRVVGVSDGGPDDSAEPILKWCAQNGHEPRVIPDWRKMLDETRPEALVVCGPFELHAQMSVEAIGRGIHVFVEKPAALTLEDLERLKVAHRAHPQVHIAGMMGIRYDPGFLTAWKLIQAGAIGSVTLLNGRKSYKLGRRPAFYQDRATYGGTIPWVGSHAIDWVLWMSQGAAVESISALHSTMHNNNLGTMERSASCQFEMSGGCIASVSIDVFRPENASTHGDDWMRIVGTGGVIEARNKSVSLINSDNDGSKPVEVASDRQVFVDFVKHIEKKQTALIDAEQTLVLTEVCLLARQAADERRLIKIDSDRRLGFSRTTAENRQ